MTTSRSLMIPSFCNRAIQALVLTSKEVQKGSSTRMIKRLLILVGSVDRRYEMGRRFKTGHHHQASRFSGSGRAKHGEKLAAAHIHIEIFYHQNFAVIAFLDIDETNERIVIFGHGTSSMEVVVGKNEP